jgi:hypothetical protein
MLASGAERLVIASSFAAFSLAACSPSPGEDGSTIMLPYTALSGGMVFATEFLPGSHGYDLYWVDVPLAPTIAPQVALRLTSAGGNEWQPSVSAGGNGLVFAKEDDGIFLISTSGRVSRVSSSSDRYKDSHPAISFDGARVAWVREDHQKPIGSTGFFENFIMMANFDGKNAAPLQQTRADTGVVQDAPVFDPVSGSTRIAWSEFNATTIGPAGPVDFGVFLYDFQNNTGHYVCMNPQIAIGMRTYRCFGQHLAWPATNLIVTAQDMLEVRLDTTNPPNTLLCDLDNSIINQETGTPDVSARTFPFFPRFPLSISYAADGSRFVVDGVLVPHDLNAPTLSFFIGQVQPGMLGVGDSNGMGMSELAGVWRLPINNYANDIDTSNTADYFFSVATPQLMP